MRLGDCLASVDSYNDEGIWNWNQHGSDWIYQGGPDSSATKNMPWEFRGAGHDSVRQGP